MDLFHPGFIYETPVNINLVVAGMARRVLFTNDIFDYGPEVPVLPSTEEIPDTRASAYGRRSTRPTTMDEFLVFQGASYFRGVARDQIYGLSARGLAVRHRASGRRGVSGIHRFLDRAAGEAVRRRSPSTRYCRAARWSAPIPSTSTPGDETVIDVDATLFPRTELTAYGIAPLTSMFLFDPSSRGRFDDFAQRRARLRRPANRQWPRRTRLAAARESAHAADVRVSRQQPARFRLAATQAQLRGLRGLRMRATSSRPSLWVEPRGEWGDGHVELVEIPSDREIHDNIVAYWQPAAPLAAGQRHRLLVPPALTRASRSTTRSRASSPRAREQRRRPPTSARS